MRIVAGWQRWEHLVGHHDELTDIGSLGELLVALLCGLDLADEGDAALLQRRRNNLFALAPALHPVLATVASSMIAPDRRRRAQRPGRRDRPARHLPRPARGLRPRARARHPSRRPRGRAGAPARPAVRRLAAQPAAALPPHRPDPQPHRGVGAAGARRPEHPGDAAVHVGRPGLRAARGRQGRRRRLGGAVGRRPVRGGVAGRDHLVGPPRPGRVRARPAAARRRVPALARREERPGHADRVAAGAGAGHADQAARGARLLPPAADRHDRRGQPGAAAPAGRAVRPAAARDDRPCRRGRGRAAARQHREAGPRDAARRGGRPRRQAQDRAGPAPRAGGPAGATADAGRPPVPPSGVGSTRTPTAGRAGRRWACRSSATGSSADRSRCRSSWATGRGAAAHESRPSP